MKHSCHGLICRDILTSRNGFRTSTRVCSKSSWRPLSSVFPRFTCSRLSSVPRTCRIGLSPGRSSFISLLSDQHWLWPSRIVLRPRRSQTTKRGQRAQAQLIDGTTNSMKVLCLPTTPELLGRVFAPTTWDALCAEFDVTQNDGEKHLQRADLLALIDGHDAVVTTWGSPRFGREVLDMAPQLKLIAHAAGSVKFLFAPDEIPY